MERNLNELLQKGESKYLLVTVAAKRLKKLLNGEKPLVNYDAEEQTIDVKIYRTGQIVKGIPLL